MSGTDLPRSPARLPRVGKFGLATAIGFLVTEGVLLAGILLAYHDASVPRSASSSLGVLGLDVLAFGTGVTVAFLLNERFTVGAPAHAGGTSGGALATRWARYQLAALLGNLVVVGVQIGLLAGFSVSPVLGSIVGALVSYPLTYVVSMRFVWSARTPGPSGDPLPAGRAAPPRPRALRFQPQASARRGTKTLIDEPEVARDALAGTLQGLRSGIP